MRALALSGSLRSGSHNRELLRLAAAVGPGDLEVVTSDALAALPPYHPDAELPAPRSVDRFRADVRGADAVLIATPEYNGSIPGQLKNALDWASRPEIMVGPFWGKPVAVVSASTGRFGGVWAQQDLKRVLKTMGARVVDTPEVAVAKAHERLQDPDEELRHALRATWAALLESVRPGQQAA